MNACYVDSSCIVAVALAEPGYEALAQQLESFDRLFASNLLAAELRAALHREGVDADDGIPRNLAWVLPDRPLTPEIEAVLAAGYLRGADVWHLACALYLSPEPRELVFMTVDRHQAAVAAALGFAGVPG